MLTLRRLFSVFLPTVLIAASVSANEYEERTQALLAEFGVADASSSTYEFDSTLETAFLRADLGVFALYGPNGDFGKGDAAENYKLIAGEMLRMQRVFLGWADPATDIPKEVYSDLDLVEDWVDSWSTRSINMAAKKGGNLLDLLDAREGQRVSIQRFAEYMGKGGPIPTGREAPEPETVVLVNHRERYVNFMAFAGWIRPELQSMFWTSDVEAWTNFFLDGRNFYSTKYFGGDGGEGIPMTVRARTGLEQQIIQLSTNAMLDNIYGSKIPPALAGGLSVNMVVDLYGECNTRVDGDLRERRTDAIEIFVPGGIDNGILPKNMADSRWRVKNHGKTRFVDELKSSQKKGAKELRERTDFAFMLKDDNGARETVVQAPFLGKESAKSIPPETFFGDYEEFRRAYRTCFVHWLKSASMDKSKPQSQEAFSKLLVELGICESSTDILAAFEAAYGVPLSSPEMSEDALETRFLNWLPKAR